MNTQHDVTGLEKVKQIKNIYFFIRARGKRINRRSLCNLILALYKFN